MPKWFWGLCAFVLLSVARRLGFDLLQPAPGVVVTATATETAAGVVVAAMPEHQPATVTDPLVSVATATDCPAADQLTQDFTRLRFARKQHSQQLVTLMRTAQLKPALQLAWLREVGGDVSVLNQRGRRLRDGVELLLRQHQNIVKVHSSDMAKVKQAMERQDYTALIDWLQQHPQPENIPRLGFMQLTLLQFILLRDRQLQPTQLQQLLHTGLSVGLTDLILASKSGLDLHITDMLNQAFHGDPRHVWLENDRVLNLTLLAARRGDSALFDYWLAQGVPAALSPTEYNAFDLLPLPADATAMAAILPLVRTLLRQQLVPLAAERQWFWLQFLPAGEAAQLHELMQTDPTGPDPLNTAESAMLSDALRHASTALNDMMARYLRCQSQAVLPALLAEHKAESPFDQLLAVADNTLQQISSDAASVQRMQQFEQINQQIKLLISTHNWQGLDQYAQQLITDNSGMFYNQRRFVSEYMLTQMLLAKAPAAEIMQRLKKIGKRLPRTLLTHLQYNDDPLLKAMLAEAGYQIPPLPTR